MTLWEYARLEYRSAGTLGTDRFLDWDAVFHSPTGREHWGTDERYNDLPHLNKAGADGWQAYERNAVYHHNEPYRLFAVTYSFRRPIG